MAKLEWRRFAPSRAFGIYLLSVLAISLLAVLLLLLFYPGKGPEGAFSTVPVESERFPFHRIKLPPQALELTPEELVNVRPRRSAWSEEELKQYWIPPEPIVEELLAEENRRVLEGIFHDLP